MESLKLPKSGSGANTPTGKSPTSAGSSGSSNISVTVRFNAGDECVESIYPTFQNSSPSNRSVVVGGGGAVGGANSNSPASSGTGGGDSVTLISGGGDSLASSPSQHQILDDQTNRNHFLQGNFFNRKSGLSPTLCQQQQQQQQHQQLSPNRLGLRDGSGGSGAHSPSSPIGPGSGLGNLTYNGTFSGSKTSFKNCGGSGGLSPSASINAIDLSPKYSSNLLDLVGASTVSNNSASGSGNCAVPTLSLGGGGGGGVSCSGAKAGNGVTTQADIAFIGTGSSGGGSNSGVGGVGSGNGCGNGSSVNYARNGLDMRQIDHCIGDIMRNMSGGVDNSISATACALADRMRNNGKINEQHQHSHSHSHQHQNPHPHSHSHRLSEADAVAIAAGSNNCIIGSSGGGGGGSGTGTGTGSGGGGGNSFLDGNMKHSSPSRNSPHPAIVNAGSGDTVARYSRKVFVGGLPPDIDEDEITASFRRFGPLVVDWPHKAESKSYFPPKGYAFLLFQDETSVQNLIDACIIDDEKLYLCVSSPTIKDKPVQIRPWRLNDADYVLDATMSLDPRKTVFVGGVPRPLKAFELAMIMDRLYGGVCYAGIDTDPELKYPKGAGRVAFSNQQSYISAISARFVQLQHADIDKRVEVKPYVLDDQMCDECEGQRCCGKFAPFFCANVTCLQYYCEHCWAVIHSRPGREYHKPLVKEGADRPRAVPFRWC